MLIGFNSNTGMLSKTVTCCSLLFPLLQEGSIVITNTRAITENLKSPRLFLKEMLELFTFMM
jgi:hypothetical protein